MLANYWKSQLHEVTVVTLSDESSDFYCLAPGVRRLALGVASVSSGLAGAVLKNISRIRAIRRAILQHQPQFVIGFCDTNNILTLLACIGLPATVILSERVHPERYAIGLAWSLLRRLTYPFADVVIVQTRRTLEWVVRHWRIDPNRVVAIPNPVSFVGVGGDLEFAGVSKRAIEQERLMGSAPTVIAIGRLVPQKGFDLLLPAFAGVAKRFPEWRLVILGEGPERSKLEGMRDNYGLQGRVTFPGTLPVTERLLERARVFVLSSRYEGFPNALLEAMAAGLAVISFDCPTGPRELIENGKNGVLVPPDQVVSLEASLLELVSDPLKRQRLGDHARGVRDLYSVDEVGKQWMRVLNDRAGR
jgi:glycosyltransferase involved in cell wall biosynthesis